MCIILRLRGDFDDCQKIIKKLFIDNEFVSTSTTFTAINSINWVRIIAQSCLFFLGLSTDAKQILNKINFIVPIWKFW